MPHVMPQVALHRVISEGVQILRNNIHILDDIFQYYTNEAMNAAYGQRYVDQIKTWFTETEIPIVQAWSMNVQHVPQVSIKLASEQEDESKAAIGDYFGAGDIAEVGVSPFTVLLDINLMTSRNGDETLWLYYIVNYILFKRKRRAEQLGLQIHTFSASDYDRNFPKMADNIWVRTIKFRCTVQNFWDASPYLDIDRIHVDIDAEGEPSGEMVDVSEFDIEGED